MSTPKRLRRSVTVSPFFAKALNTRLSPPSKDKTSCIPFPPLSATSFGLVQERLSRDPFRLLLATIFLNKTRGVVALPVLYELMARYPTPAVLAQANHKEVVEVIQHLGLQNQRATRFINIAATWLAHPPQKGQRYRCLHYPKHGDGKDVRPGEVLEGEEQDQRIAWEVAHLPGLGAYAIDSWRIFCRDDLLERENLDEMDKEWTRVLPLDKELRAYLRWRWLKSGWEWNPTSGEKKMADPEIIGRAKMGGVIYEGESGVAIYGDGTMMDMDNEGPKVMAL